MSDAPFPPRPRLLVLELWGLGDLALATTFLQAAAVKWDITLVAKPYAEPLLRPTFPHLRFEPLDAPWTVHRGKYRLHRWPWGELGGLVRRLRAQHFEAAVSVRADPRDHLLMALAGARRRLGFPRSGSRALLTEPLARGPEQRHKVEDWRALASALSLPGAATAEPRLTSGEYRSERLDALFAGITKPVFCFHPGAKIKVRRWPEAYFAEIVQQLRRHFDFHLLLVPDTDGYGSALSPLADTILPALSVGELVAVLGRADLVLGNDSGPAHIAAATGRPVIALFGPQLPVWFRPWGAHSRAVVRDLCALRPCFDYCPFPEPYCLTRLRPEETWPEIQQHLLALIRSGVLPSTLLRRS